MGDYCTHFQALPVSRFLLSLVRLIHTYLKYRVMLQSLTRALSTCGDVIHRKDSVALFKVLNFPETCISVLTGFSLFVQIQNVLSNCKKLFKNVTYYQNFHQDGLLRINLLGHQATPLFLGCNLYVLHQCTKRGAIQSMISRHPLISRTKGKYRNNK